MSINCRQKGASAEREAATLLADLFKLPVHRGCQYKGGPSSPDVAGLDGLNVEVKRRRRLHLESALQQAIEDADPGVVPVVMHRADREEWKFTIYSKDVVRFVATCTSLIDLGQKRVFAAESLPTNNTQPSTEIKS